jgi:hypothetical protein
MAVNFHQGFRQGVGDRPEARSKAGGQYHCSVGTGSLIVHDFLRLFVQFIMKQVDGHSKL